MDLNYLKEFVVLAECGNYREAAEELFVSQSSLSKHIISLEKELDCNLFLRTTRGISLTEYGRRLITHANKILTDEDRMRLAMSQDRAIGEENGISIASEYRRVSRLMSGFMRKYPQYTINVQLGDSRTAKEALRNNSVELGFAKAFHAEDSDLFYVPFGKEVLCAILPVGDPLIEKDMIRIMDLRERDFILPSRNASHTRNIVRVCQQNGFTPHVTAFIDDEMNICSLVEQGFGISALFVDPESFSMSQNLRTIQIEPKSEVQGALCYRKDVELSPGATCLLEYARDCYPRAL